MPEAKTYIHAATVLQLASWRHFVPFLIASRRVQARLRRTPGHVKHGVRGNPLRLTFRTYSIYEDYESLQDFVYSEEHAAAMRKMPMWTGSQARAVTWNSASTTIDWGEAAQRLATAQTYPEKPAQSR